MSGHPNEVVTILLTNPTCASPGIFRKAVERAGLGDKVYTPPQRIINMDDWPTWQEMIDSKRRLVVFLDYGSNQNKVPWLLDEFAYIVDRARPNTETGTRFSVINHTLDLGLLPGDDEVLVPAAILAEKTNSRESIMGQVGLCQAAHGKTPSVVLLDYVHNGNVMTTQNELNHLV